MPASFEKDVYVVRVTSPGYNECAKWRTNHRETRPTDVLSQGTTMKSALAFLLLASIANGQNLSANIPYVDPGHERNVLDIYTPENAKNLPVVFWIHGGGW